MNPNFSLTRKLAMALALAAITASAGAAPPVGMTPQKAVELAGQPFDRQEALARRAEIHDWLMSEVVAEGLRNPISVTVSASEKAGIDNASRATLPQRVGLTKALSVKVAFDDVNLKRLNKRSLVRPNGAMQRTADGGYVFTTAFRSPDAAALRVHFTGFRVPTGAGVFLFTESGQVFGPYTGRGPHGTGEFWSHTVTADTVFLQLRHVGAASHADLRDARFNIAGLGHIRKGVAGLHCDNNASCVENAECPGTDSAVSDARDAVAHMQWVSGPYIYICSGGLVADTDAGSSIPYFLTANHCISRGKDARNLENFFQLTAPCGTASCADIFDHQANHPQELRTLGATIKSTDRGTDHTLMQLDQAAPSGSAYLGWTSAPVAFTNGVPLFRISHPDGSPQAYSEHVVDADVSACQSWPRGDRIYSRDTFGATEGGSSGSPVVNASGQIVGQLSGACGFNLDDVCDAVDNATVDGAFAAYFSDVEPFLDPGTSCTPEPENCGDGIDNDCDGLVDGDDPDCGGGGLPPGAACMVDSDCASNKCKGKPGQKTCR